MKKIIALLLVFLLVFSMAACGSSSQAPADEKEKETTPAAPDTAEPETPAGDAAGPEDEGDANVFGGDDEVIDNSFTGEIGMFDPDYDYSQNPTYMISYYVLNTGVLYEGFSEYFEAWCGRMNCKYGGIQAAGGDKDAYLSNLTTIAQNNDGLLVDADATQYDRVAEILNEIGTPWMTVMSAPRDYTKDNQPLLHPYVGYDNYLVGTMMPPYLLDMFADLWPDSDLSTCGFITVDHTVSPPLHLRAQGCHDALVETDPAWEDRYFVADTSIAHFDVDTSNTVVSAILAAHPEFEHWLVFAEMDDMALGAALSFDSVGLTDNAAVVTFGGTAAVLQWDTGRQDAWRAALYATYPVYSEPLMNGLYAMINGDATAETLWPEWVDVNDPGYAKRLLPAYWITYDTYKKVIRWGDIYGGFDFYPQYPSEGLTRDTYSSYVAVPDYYSTPKAS